MYLTPHAAAGLAFAAAAPNAPAAFIIGLASHYLLDVIPHGDEHLIPKHLSTAARLRRMLGIGVLDGIIMLGLVLLYFWTTPELDQAKASLAVFGAVLPDALQAIWYAFGSRWLKPLQKLQNALHNPFKRELSWEQGAMIQGLVLAACWLTLM